MADFEWLAPGGHQRLVDNVVGLFANKPDATGTAPLLTAGAALGITGNDAEESAWLARTSGADGVASVRSIHGRTLRWNQLYNALTFNFSGTSYGVVADGTGKWTVTVNEGGASGDSSNISGAALVSTTFTAGHKYLITTNNASITLFLKSYGTRTNTIFTASTAQYNNVALSFTDLAAGTYVLYPQLFDLTAMFGAGSEPSTVAEFEALYPLPYYEYDAGSLLPVNMEGIESTGFNQWDEQWDIGSINITTGAFENGNRFRSKNLFPVFPNTEYNAQFNRAGDDMRLFFYDADEGFISESGWKYKGTFTTPANARYMAFYMAQGYGTTYNHDICINLSDPTRNGEYVPYWHQTRPIPAGTLRSAGSVYDEQTATERITRVGVVDLGTLTWSNPATNIFNAVVSDMATSVANKVISAVHDYATNNFNWSSVDSYADKSISTAENNYIYVKDTSYADAATFKAAMSGVMLHYALATPTVTPHEQPLNMTYRTEQGGTERVMVPTGELSAPPTIMTAQGYTAESLRDAALSAIAPVENGKASANYGVGSYLVHGGQLCKVTVAIATGEAITIGTNVTATTVMAEVIALTQ